MRVWMIRSLPAVAKYEDGAVAKIEQLDGLICSEERLFGCILPPPYHTLATWALAKLLIGLIT